MKISIEGTQHYTSAKRAARLVRELRADWTSPISIAMRRTDYRFDFAAHSGLYEAGALATLAHHEAKHLPITGGSRSLARLLTVARRAA